MNSPILPGLLAQLGTVASPWLNRHPLISLLVHAGAAFLADVMTSPTAPPPVEPPAPPPVEPTAPPTA